MINRDDFLDVAKLFFIFFKIIFEDVNDSFNMRGGHNDS